MGNKLFLNSPFSVTEDCLQDMPRVKSVSVPLKMYSSLSLDVVLFIF